MGITMNHISAVVAPVAGGLAWHFFGYQVIFFSAAALALVSLICSQWINTEIPTQAMRFEQRAATDLARTEPRAGS